MKKLILLAVFTVSMQCAFAQTYYFTTSAGTYKELSNPVIVSSNAWADEFYNLALPFPFTFFDSVVTDVFFDSNGALTFDITRDDDLMFLVHMTERTTGGPSDVSYEITGTAPNRILKFQWRNAASLGESPQNTYLNFQIWIEETTNDFSFHIGDAYIASTDVFNFGNPRFFVSNYNWTETYQLEGNPANPDLVYNSDTIATLNAMPASGTVYTFSLTPPTGIKNNNTISYLHHYPNPADQNINISFNLTENQKIELLIYDVSGRAVKTAKYNLPAGNQNIKLTTDELLPGLYFYTLTGNNFSTTNKIIISR